MKNYLVYPTKKMFISQSYTGNYSHNKSSQGNPKDYPIDESCGSTGRDYFYCPCDEVIVKRIYGVGIKGTNTIWLESTKPVILANGKESYVTIMVVHPNDDTLKGIKAGDKFKRGQKMFLEGNDGNATGNHFHISVSASKYVSGGWQENNKGAWVIKGNPIKPEDAFFVDEEFTTISKSNGLTFKKLPKYVGNPVERDETKLQIEVIASELRARKVPNGAILGYINKGVYNILDMGLSPDYTWFEVEKDMWIASKEGVWTHLYEMTKIENAQEDVLKVEESPIIDQNGKDMNVSNKEESDTNVGDYEDNKDLNNPLLYIIDLIINFIKKIFRGK